MIRLIVHLWKVLTYRNTPPLGLRPIHSYTPPARRVRTVRTYASRQSAVDFASTFADRSDYR